MPTKSTFQSCVCTYLSLYFVVFSFDVFKEFFHTYCCFGQKKSWSERRFWLRTKLFKCFTTLFHDIKRLFLPWFEFELTLGPLWSRWKQSREHLTLGWEQKYLGFDNFMLIYFWGEPSNGVCGKSWDFISTGAMVMGRSHPILFIFKKTYCFK